MPMILFILECLVFVILFYYLTIRHLSLLIYSKIYLIYFIIISNQ